MASGDSQLGDGPLLVRTPRGSIMDLRPLVVSAQVLRRNALQNAEFGDETGIDPRTLDGMLLGMEVAVRALCGDHAADLFHIHLHVPDN
jgi:hypothetical protein